MTVYRNHTPDSPIVSVEFMPVSSGNFCFITLKSPHHREAIRQWLSSREIDQEIVAETALGGQHVLVTHGDRNTSEMMDLLAQHGDSLTPVLKKKHLNLWAVRGSLSMVGQVMQLMSGFLVKGPPDGPTITFALSNIVANFSNMAFGAQKTDDVHRMRFLKRTINHKLQPHVVTAGDLPGADEQRAPLRKPPEESYGISDKSLDTMQRHSVRLGEIGLRFFGSLAMAFPVAKWKSGLQTIAREGVGAAYQSAKNPDMWTRRAGLAYVLGKLIGIAAKTPDPYNPKPHTMIDDIREKYLFRASTVIEAGAAATIAYDRFSHRKIRIPNRSFIPKSLRGSTQPDFIGGIGGLLFVAAFAARYFAKFGVRALDMEELEAHISDSIARTQPEKLPQLMAETAATVKENLKDTDISYGEIFTQMMSDLYRYHHIALDNLGTEPEERRAGTDKKPVTAQRVLVNQPGTQTPTVKKVLSKPPAASHQERVAATAANDTAHITPM